MKNIPKDAYGLLLTFDGYGASKDLCGDVNLLHEILTALPGHINMRRLGNPHIESVDEPGIAGLSGFTFIMESHISIHTYIERGFVTADIYSCKWFDTEEAAKFLVKAFHIDSFEVSDIIRGARFNLNKDVSGRWNDSET
jgi:S-adenosylmethionine decarboxylase